MSQAPPVRTREVARIRSVHARDSRLEHARAARTSQASKRGAPTLNHIAIIPDGNRRWAAARGIPVWEGVRTGAQTAERTFEALVQRKIHGCTFWASSYDNLTERPRTERRVLNELFATWFSALAENPTIHREQVRVRVLGEWQDLLGAHAVRAIERTLDVTRRYTSAELTFLVGYDGDRELLAATKSLLKAVGSRQLAIGALTLDDLRKHAWTQELPGVDLIVRCGSWQDPHRSANFLPLITSNTQEAYPEVLWPDFSEAELDAVLADYASRTRRFGR